MINKYILFFVFLFTSLDLVAGKKDSTYIIDLADKVTIKPYFTHTFLDFNYLLSESLPNQVYKPNTTFDLGVSIGHRWFGAAYSTGLTQVGDPSIYGKTKYWDIQLDAFIDKSCVEFVFQDYKGFFLSNASTIAKSLDDTLPNIIRNDIEVLNSSLHYLYLFNGNKLSLRATYSQSERQKKSAGSFILGASISYFNISGDYSLLNSIYENNVTNQGENKYKMGYFITPSIRFGYAYNFILFKHLSILLMVTPGISYGISSYKLENDESRFQRSFNLQGQSRYGLQFNTDKFFVGMDGVSDFYTHRLSNNSFLFNSTRMEIFVGFRITAPKFICPECK